MEKKRVTDDDNPLTNPAGNALKLFPVWSNVLYFVAAVFSLVLAACSSYKAVFVLFFLLFAFTGSFSVVYHLNAPGWAMRPGGNGGYRKWLAADESLSITTVVVALLATAWKVYAFPGRSSRDSNLYFAVIFAIVAVVFYSIAHGYLHHATKKCPEEERRRDCFIQNTQPYQLYHGAWHLFTGVASLFFLQFLQP